MVRKPPPFSATVPHAIVNGNGRVRDGEITGAEATALRGPSLFGVARHSRELAVAERELAADPHQLPTS